LAKFPNHGQTLAMKGLIMNCMDKKPEAYELVKLGIKNDIRSHIPWHVLGLLHRSDRNYKEAVKCYKTAVKLEPENQQMLRDLSWMQAQILDFQGFCDTRRNILLQKPGYKINWIAFAISHYLTGNYTESLDVMTKFFATNTEDRSDFETSEYLLFENRCIASTGDIDKAMDHLYDKEHEICDKNSLRIRAAEYLIYLGRHDESLNMWLDMIKDMPENYRLHAGAQVAVLRMAPEQAREMLALKRLALPCTALTLTEEQRSIVGGLYGVGGPSRIKASRATRKILLSLQPSPAAFREALDKQLRALLEEGVPSLCHDICALVMQPDPAHPDRNVYVKDLRDFGANSVCVTTLELVSGYITNLRENGTFFPTTGTTAVAAPGSGPPTCLLWALFLRCHLLEMSGRYLAALSDAEACVAHTPTALDMHVKQARIYKRLGDVKAAAAVVEECRSLDLQDRYLNNKATKYFLRANKVGNAMDTIAMFTKEEGVDPQYALYDLQCVWYELECGEAYERMSQQGPALKKFYAVEKHFLDFLEDKFDFHGYTLRKVYMSLNHCC
jgi:tetratricopeptide (TPR) repeat protein